MIILRNRLEKGLWKLVLVILKQSVGVREGVLKLVPLTFCRCRGENNNLNEFTCHLSLILHLAERKRLIAKQIDTETFRDDQTHQRDVFLFF